MAESSVYLFSPTFQFMNVSGKPLADGYIEVYISGTRSKYCAWSDFDGTLHPFKIPLNALGSAVVLVSPAHSYDVYVYNSLGVLQMSRYNITPATGEGTVITDVTTIASKDQTVEITANSSTEYDLSVARALQNTSDSVLVSAKNYTDEELATGLSTKKDKQSALEFKGSAVKTVKKIAQNADGVMSVEFEDIDLSNKKDKQSALEFSGSAVKTIKKITQNDNGVMSVEFEDIDLPQEVPNVNVTSTDNSITVNSSIDPDTNTKTFDLSVNGEEVEYARFIASDVTATATLIKTRGNLELSNNKIQLKKGTLYHFTVRGSYVATTLSNTISTLAFIEYSTFNLIHINVDNSIYDNQFFEFSFDVITNNDIAYPVGFSGMLNAKVSSLEVDVHSVVASSSGAMTYGAGDAIDLTNNNISVKYGKGLTVNASNELEVNTDIIATKESVVNKKDKQKELTFNGSSIKTVKKITQNADGVMDVEFEDIDISQVTDITNDFEFINGFSGVQGFKVYYYPTMRQVMFRGQLARSSTLGFNDWESCLKYIGTGINFTSCSVIGYNFGVGSPQGGSAPNIGCLFGYINPSTQFNYWNFAIRQYVSGTNYGIGFGSIVYLAN